jgi:hypothetical protein
MVDVILHVFSECQQISDMFQLMQLERLISPLAMLSRPFRDFLILWSAATKCLKIASMISS